MATIGRGVYAQAVYEFFEGIRGYDVDRAVAVLAEDADWQSPWNEGTVTGRDAIREVLEGVLGDPATRPSFSIMDVSGDGTIVRLKVSISGRFGRASRPHMVHLLHLKGVIHQVVIRPV